MQTPRDAESYGFQAAKHELLRESVMGDIPTLDSAGTRALEAWFLGPKAENADELERLIVEAIRDHVFWRRNYHPGDPSHITDEIKRTPEFLQAQDQLKENYRQLLAWLKKSVPFFSMRYQGHMNWDLTIPGMLGYFSAMLYNPNNVAFEGSTATTILEMRVGDDICRMLGYTIPSNAEIDRGAVRPWGHITCDGTVANIEAIWAARNLKFYPLALKAALTEHCPEALDISVPLPQPARPEVALKDLTSWQLLNLGCDDILALPQRIAGQFNIDVNELGGWVASHSVQSMGMAEFWRLRVQDAIKPPVLLVSGTKHYSFPKAVALLGLGASNLIDIEADEDARMSIAHLRAVLEKCRTDKSPVIAVVAVMGTTEESALDPITEVLEHREDCRAQGLEFIVHADAAWGGYHVSLVRPDFPMEKLPGLVPPAPPAIPLSKYSRQQLEAIGKADSITVDPHKSGYIPYPAGALCYRNAAMRNLVAFSAPVIYHGEAEPTVGIYGVEGSKPGAAAAAVYLSHSVIRPSQSGYGKIIGQALFSCKKLYARLLCMNRPDDPFVCIPVPRLPAERKGQDQAAIDRELEFIRQRINGKSNSQLVGDPERQLPGDPEALKFLEEIGPDENILSYAFNFRWPDGTWNTDLSKANDLNQLLYKKLRIEPGKDIYGYDLIVSTTDLSAQHYGNRFVDSYKKRMGVEHSPGDKITVLRSVVMDPWVTETQAGSFIDVLEAEFRKALAEALQFLFPITQRGY